MSKNPSPTLDHAKRLQGHWIRVDENVHAMLAWTSKDGWVLKFGYPTGYTFTFTAFAISKTIITGWRVTKQIRFHKERTLKGYSWPGQTLLIELKEFSGPQLPSLPAKKPDSHPARAFGWMRY